VQSELHMGHKLAHKEQKKTSAWNAFTWKKSQQKENSVLIMYYIVTLVLIKIGVAARS
jgi:hypothetical protein